MFERLFSGSTPLWIVLTIILGVYLYVTDKKKKSDTAAALCKRYARLTPETLNALPDEELVRAVIANVMAKQDLRHPDPTALLPLLSRGRAAVYSVWLLCHELETQDFEALFRSPSRRLAEPAADGLEHLGASNSATALRAALRAAEDDTRAPLWEAVTTVFREAVNAEQPLTLCMEYIRENPDEFTDD